MTPSWCDELKRFEQYLRQSGLSRSTIANYLLDLRGFSAWLQQSASESTPATYSSVDVVAYKRYLQENLVRSPASINRTMQSLRKFGRYIQTAGLQPGNPAQEVPLLAWSNQTTTQILTQEQVQRLVEIAERRNSRTAARDEAILHLLVHAGLRAGEIIFLQVNDLDFAESTAVLTIRRQGKTPERRVPMDTATQAALQRYLDQGLPPYARCSYVFCGRDSTPLSIRSVQQVVASLGKAAGMEITAKVLRDTCARELWRRTNDLNLLIQRMGIRRPETALKYITTGSDPGLASTVGGQPAFGAAG